MVRFCHRHVARFAKKNGVSRPPVAGDAISVRSVPPCTIALRQAANIVSFVNLSLNRPLILTYLLTYFKYIRPPFAITPCICPLLILRTPVISDNKVLLCILSASGCSRRHFRSTDNKHALSGVWTESPYRLSRGLHAASEATLP